MHEDCVPPDAARLAGALAGPAARHRLALGGGTACALRLGHRVSRDLDLFALQALDPPGLLADLSALGEARLRGISANELVAVVGQVQVSATSLGRAPLAPPDTWQGLPVLSERDLAALKVDAAIRRGLARDLCDLHLLCAAGVDVAEALRAASVDAVVALKALTDAARFEGQPALALTRPWSVGEGVAYFAEAARRLLG